MGKKEKGRTAAERDELRRRKEGRKAEAEAAVKIHASQKFLGFHKSDCRARPLREERAQERFSYSDYSRGKEGKGQHTHTHTYTAMSNRPCCRMEKLQKPREGEHFARHGHGLSLPT